MCIGRQFVNGSRINSSRRQDISDHDCLRHFNKIYDCDLNDAFVSDEQKTLPARFLLFSTCAAFVKIS